MRHLHIADFLHALLASLLLFKQFALTAYVAAVALCGHVLAHLLHRFACNDFRADGRLDSDVELLARQQFFEFLADASAEGDGIIHVRQGGECVHGFAVQQNVEFYKFGRTKL